MLEHFYAHTERVGVVVVETAIHYTFINFELKAESIEIKASGITKPVDARAHDFFLHAHKQALIAKAAEDIEELKRIEMGMHNKINTTEECSL